MNENPSATSTGPWHSMREFKAFFGPKLTGLNQQEGLSARWQIAIFILVLLALFSRDTSLFLHAQFFAEDGKYWYAQAYNGGWLHSLSIPQAGYLSTVQRLGSGLAMLVPFRWAPLAMMIVGLLIQALPVPILLSPRCRNWAPLSVRILFAAIYVAIPNAREIHVVSTNSQWHLVVAELFLAFAATPRTIAGRLLDVLVFVVGSVSGPFVLVLMPFVLFFWWVRRQRWSLVLLAIMAIGSVAQLIVLRHHEAERTWGYLGARPGLFIRLLGGDVFTGALLGSHAFGLSMPSVFSLGMLAIGIALCAYFFQSVSLPLKLFIIYCFVLFAVSMRNPLVYTTAPIWNVLLGIPSIRYWYLPSLPFLFAILWCAACAPHRAIRVAGRVLVLFLLIGICKDWRIPPMADMHFDQAVATFQAAPPGAPVILHINPVNPGNPLGWQMELIKK